MADPTPPPNPSRRKLFSWLVDREQAGQIGAEAGKIVRQAKEIAEELSDLAQETAALTEPLAPDVEPVPVASADLAAEVERLGEAVAAVQAEVQTDAKPAPEPQADPAAPDNTVAVLLQQQIEIAGQLQTLQRTLDERLPQAQSEAERSHLDWLRDQTKHLVTLFLGATGAALFEALVNDQMYEPLKAWVVEQVEAGKVQAQPASPAAEWSHVKVAHSYTGEYFANRDLIGSPALVRKDSDIDFDWDNCAPGPGVPANNFSVRWTNTLLLDSGRYRFNVETDDGVRLFINDRLVIDKWHVQARTKHTYEISLSCRDVHVRMEYFDEWGAAFARLRIEVFREESRANGNLITYVPPQPQNHAWIKLYRLNSANQWVAVSPAMGSYDPTGYLKIDGLMVDVNRFGSVGEPYKVEQCKVDPFVKTQNGSKIKSDPPFLDEMVMDRRRCS